MRGSASESGSPRIVATTNNARLLVMIPAVIAVLLASPPGTSAQESPPSQTATDRASQVLAFERQVEEAVLQADVAFLDRVCASDFTYTHGDGWTTGRAILGVDTKSEWLASLPGRYALREVDSQHVEIQGLSGFPNAETLNLTMSYVDVGLIGHRVQTRKGPV